jgi:hypothetical protein
MAVLAACLVCFLTLVWETVVLPAAQGVQKLREWEGQQDACCVLPGL